jgi:hypothetical protein
MKKSGRNRFTPGEVRELFRRAEPPESSDVRRLADGVHAMLAQARRERSVAPTVAEALVPISARMLPAMAVATAILIGAVVALGSREASVTTANGVEGGIDRLVLIGSLDGESEDVVLRALAGVEEDHE